MKCLLFLALLAGPFTRLAAGEIPLDSGKSRLSLIQSADGQSYTARFSFSDREIDTLTPGKPLSLEVDGTRLDAAYAEAVLENGGITCRGVILSEHGTRFHFTDRFTAETPGAFRLQRSVTITDASPKDHGFNSLFGVTGTSKSTLREREFFVPGIWYRSNFDTKMAGALAADPNDTHFLFREDRLPLPLAMLRNPSDGQTLALIHANAVPETFDGESGVGRIIDERMKFGSIGVRQLETTSLMFLFPGSEGEKNHVDRRDRDRWALRAHPVRQGIRHDYQLVIALSKTPDYSAAIAETWKSAFALYHPEIRPVDIATAYRGLIDTLDHYFVGEKDGYDAPGFPFSVHLPDGKVRAYNYQMGFVGRQIPNAYLLFREGILGNRADLREKGSAILDFWANHSLTPSGLPRTWYDPAKGSNARGSWRSSDNPRGGTAMRVATTGMEGMLAAWKFAKHYGSEQPTWLATCRRFGDWLVANQNSDGSWFLAYAHELTDGKNPPTSTGKLTTVNPIRFLVLLHLATGDPRFREAALRAGKFSLKHIHHAYHYAGSVIDNPNVIDRESGQEALYAFLALHDLTGEKPWLDAAVQAARYTETWMYAYEVPPASGCARNDFPADRSIVGQTLIATGHSAADLGLAFSAFDYYRLHLFTGDEHFLQIAKLLIHNTKQALNWDGSLYPGQQKGLQLEAFTVTLPRRRGVMECLSWNYTAHLDPLARFQDGFGSMDIDAIEKLPLPQRQEMNRRVLSP
ncbi:MAG: hypothetical protein V4640_07150 [Verrucomicrobiota bacterium]